MNALTCKRPNTGRIFSGIGFRTWKTLRLRVRHLTTSPQRPFKIFNRVQIIDAIIEADFHYPNFFTTPCKECYTHGGKVSASGSEICMQRTLLPRWVGGKISVS
ncbi:hypothetical protein AVEN_86148-1 [Araneus ventricosus]|uniref:Uncharacterized protein n=1 Tax=Araneus ventricosus TaxID=182803 RepID=A0A4Y2L065_ARAVE|nr:hypothetical protein AVEN_86148-1 [Araneus ventricosus]